MILLIKENNTELIRTDTNSGSMSSYQFVRVGCSFFSYQNTEDTKNYYNSMLSVSSVIDYLYIDNLTKKSDLNDRYLIL